MPASSSPFSPRIGLTQRAETIRRFLRTGRANLDALLEQIPTATREENSPAAWDETWAEPFRDVVQRAWFAHGRVAALLSEANQAAARRDIKGLRRLADALNRIARTGPPGRRLSALTVDEAAWWWQRIVDMFSELQKWLEAQKGRNRRASSGRELLAILEDARERWERDALPADHGLQRLMPTWLAIARGPKPWSDRAVGWLEEAGRLRALSLTSLAARFLAGTYETGARTARRVVREHVKSLLQEAVARDRKGEVGPRAGRPSSQRRRAVL